MGYYPHFNLPMRSSRGFASTAPDLPGRLRGSARPVQTRFRFGFTTKSLNLARDGKSPDHYAKGTPSPFQESGIRDQPVSKTMATATAFLTPDR